MEQIESAGITHIGMKRKKNEDAFLLDDEEKVYVVTDRMVGHQAGEVASGLVIETIRDYMQRSNKEGTDIDEMVAFDEILSKEANRLLSSIQVAGLGVYRVSQTTASDQGMGSKVSAIYFTNETIISANVGDRPIYLIHKDTIERLSPCFIRFWRNMQRLTPKVRQALALNTGTCSPGPWELKRRLSRM